MKRDRVFRDICLTSDALDPLIENDPKTAAEILLALLVEEPQEVDGFGGTSSKLDYFGINDVHGWYPPSFFRGPFLSLLRKDPSVGVDVVLRLVNFAASRAGDPVRNEGGTPYSVTIPFPDGPRVWTAHSNMYAWYRDFPPAPHAVVTALMALEKWLYEELDGGHSIESHLTRILSDATTCAFAGLLIAVAKKSQDLLVGHLKPLLCVPEFFSWDTRLSLDPGSHLMMASYRTPKPLIEPAKAFNELPHRSTPLLYITQTLCLNYVGLRERFAEVSAEWARRLAAIEPAETELKQEIERLIAQHDKSNYMLKDGPGGQFWDFHPPPHVRSVQEKKLAALEKSQLLLTFPMRARQALDRGELLSAGELSEYWQLTQTLTTLDLREVSDDFPTQREDGICGGIAVMVLLGRDFLRDHPEREQWCARYLTQITTNPPLPGDMDSPHSASNFHWDHFCAEALPVLWSEQQDSPALRSLIARVADVHHYNTAALLMHAAARVRDRLGDDFLRLQHLVLRLAAARWQLMMSRHDEGAPRHDDLKQWFEQASVSFVNRTLPPTLPEWSELANAPPWIGKRGRPGLDLELIARAFGWMPALAEARSETERAQWLQFWKHALSWTLRQIPPPRANERESSHMPYEADVWVLTRLATLTSELRSDENGEDIWRPVLGLGVYAHYWIEDFLQAWFFQVAEASLQPGFVATWKQMLEFAFSSSKWDLDQDGWFQLEELWCTIMGMNGINRSSWTAARQSVIVDMASYFQRWAQKCIRRPRCAIQFALFLQEPASAAIRPDGLSWLADVSETNKYFWRENGISDVLARLLEHTWRENQDDIRADAKAINAFKKLLKRLAELGNAIALELQNRIAGG
jgi:hypothetical protein